MGYQAVWEKSTKANVLRLLFHNLNGLKKKETMSCVHHVIYGVQDINTLLLTILDVVLDSLMMTL